MRYLRPRNGMRPTALLIASSLALPAFIGCGGSRPNGANLPPVDETRGSSASYTEPTTPPAQEHTGMSNRQKLVLLAGAAALYYLYKHHQNQQGEGPEGKYYQSKNGRIYYRDKDGRAHWVTPPSEGIQVPADEAQEYSRFRGYNNQNTGEDFGGSYTP